MAASSEGLTLEIERILPAERAAVFATFTEPSELAKWWGPEGFTAPSLEFVPQVGAEYAIEMQPPDGDPFRLTGTIRAVEPPSRLAFTFRWDPPDADDVETLADLSFRDVGASTAIVLRQGPFKTEERRALHHDGWNDSFDRLERLHSP